MIDPATQAEILHLFYSEKKSRRTIAFELKLHRKTVAQVIQRRSIATETGGRTVRPSILQPFHPRIDDLLKQDSGRSAVNIIQHLRPAGYTGAITILKDYLRSCRPVSEPKAFLSLEFLPGQAAQVDWGEFGDVFGIGRKVHCFVMVMCWSRKMYLEFTYSANFESFVRCHENALAFFGGHPQELWYDNLATAVAERKGRLTRFNPHFLVYVAHHGFKPIACNVASGWEKGRVEDGVKFIRGNFWPGRSFVDLDDLNRQAKEWRDTFANKRTHATTKKIPELVFEGERSHLLPLQGPFDCDEVRTTTVLHQFRIAFDGNLYTVPWTLVGKVVTIRANEKDVRIFYGQQQLTSHARCWKKGEVLKNPAHEEGLKERKAGAHFHHDLATLQSIGPQTCRYLELLPAQTKSLRSELNQLIRLLTIYGAQNLEDVMGKTLSEGMIGTVPLERLLSRTEKKNPAPLNLSDPRLSMPPSVVDLKTYDALLMKEKEDSDD